MLKQEQDQLLQLTHVAIDPNNCPLDAPLTVEIEFESLFDFPSTHWEITFIADYANKRKMVRLGATEEQHMPVGPGSMAFSIDSVDVMALGRHVLANVGRVAL